MYIFSFLLQRHQFWNKTFLLNAPGISVFYLHWHKSEALLLLEA
jgi:hypothetical protein